MPGSPADVKLVSNAMADATRRKIMAMLVENNRIQEEISKFVGPTMLDYHLQMLQQAA
jgi:predicted transcriptional regulator